MHIPGLRQRIPDHVRDQAKQAEFREPDFYVGPLVAETDDAVESSSRSDGDGDLETQMSKTKDKATSKAMTENGKSVSLMQRLQRRLLRRPRFAR